MSPTRFMGVDGDLPGYWHVLEGRLRIFTPAVKRAPRKALFVEMLLRSIDGVVHVKANPITGNVLVLFSPDVLTHHDVIATLRRADCLSKEPATRRAGDNAFTTGIRDALIQSLTDLVVRRAVCALF
ncbi:MAG TPA: hypothetical protein VJR03_07555 [Nitrospira sp.]|nr:hypothetical protein [Nitrospira sp.]